MYALGFFLPQLISPLAALALVVCNPLSLLKTKHAPISMFVTPLTVSLIFAIEKCNKLLKITENY